MYLVSATEDHTPNRRLPLDRITKKNAAALLKTYTVGMIEAPHRKLSDSIRGACAFENQHGVYETFVFASQSPRSAPR